MKTAKNPYRKGGACYLAWESGYLAALEDVNKLAATTKDTAVKLPRVIPYEEARMNESGIVEKKGKEFTGECYLFPGPLGVEFIAKAYGLIKEEYGKTWRVWDKPPTEEQRKAEPWKDGEQE